MLTPQPVQSHPEPASSVLSYIMSTCMSMLLMVPAGIQKSEHGLELLLEPCKRLMKRSEYFWLIR